MEQSTRADKTQDPDRMVVDEVSAFDEPEVQDSELKKTMSSLESDPKELVLKT